MDHKHFDAMHGAVDGLDLSAIFPSNIANRVPYSTKVCVNEWFSINFNVSNFVYLLSMYKNHLKMVKGCRIDKGPCKKALSKKDSPKTIGTRVSCNTGTGLDGQMARQA